MFKYIKFVSLLFIFSSFSVQAIESEKWEAYLALQKQADATRLVHLKYYGELIEEYKAKVGHYPFEEQADVPVYVHLASAKQAQYISDQNLYKHKKKSFDDFIQVLETGLGRDVEAYSDPQTGPGFKPNFYVYIAKKGMYCFAVHQHQEFAFANNLAEYNNKIQISNVPGMMYKTYTPEKLFSSKAFKHAMDNEQFADVDFYAKEGKFLHASN